MQLEFEYDKEQFVAECKEVKDTHKRPVLKVKRLRSLTSGQLVPIDSPLGQKVARFAERRSKVANSPSARRAS